MGRKDSNRRLGNVDANSFNTEDLTIGSYQTIDDVPTGENAGFLAVTEDGHLIVEDGQ